MSLELKAKLHDVFDSGDTERREREKETIFQLGIPFLDDALGGVLQTELLVIGADTGVGKTEFAIHVGLQAIKSGHRVLYIALEAEEHEITRRVKFRKLASEFYKKKQFLGTKLDYRTFRLGRMDMEQMGVENLIEEEMKKNKGKFFAFYKDGPFTGKRLTQIISSYKDEIDMVIVDHFHYFDFETKDRYVEMGDTMRELRSINTIYRKPIILVSHIKKDAEKLLPGKHDFHGSSDIEKTATSAVVIAPYSGRALSSQGQHSTLMSIVKSRLGGRLDRYAAEIIFNARVNVYEPRYTLHGVSPDRTELQMILKSSLPYWAVNAQNDSIVDKK